MKKRIDLFALWVQEDWESHRFRFIVEFLAWAISIGNSVMMAFTIPDPPFHIMYPLWITGCSLFAWAAWTRGSFSMLANYLLLASIDLFGFARLMLTK